MSEVQQYINYQRAVILKDSTPTDSQKFHANRFNSRRKTLVDKVLALTEFASLKTEPTLDVRALFTESLGSVALPAGAPQELLQMQRLFHVYSNFGLYVQVGLCTKKEAELAPVFNRCQSVLEEWCCLLMQIKKDARLKLYF